MSRILIGSPIRQTKEILKEFLSGLEEVEKGDSEIKYYFIDDNTDELSSALLRSFAENRDVLIEKGTDIFKSEIDYTNHNWKAELLAKVTCFKNRIIRCCIKEQYDYLFLVDSDIILDRRCLLQLLADKVDIVSNVFWNQWGDNKPLTPQCFWIPDIYTWYKEFNVPITFEEAHKIRMDQIEQMRIPGLYPVDGLGACTLISRQALEKGVDFTAIPNLKIPGEDRAFCIRAGALGFNLYMDTHYPAYHCCKEIYLDRVDEFKRDGFKFDMCQTFEEETKKTKPFPKLRKFIVRVGRKLVRDFSD